MKMPSLTLDVLLAVVALSERKTFDSAGEELSVSASAVHKRVRTAEKLFGHRLFLGTEAGMMLTEEGRIFCPEAVRTVEQALLAEEKTKACIDLNEGRLLVGHSTYLPPKLLAFVLGLRPEGPLKIRVEHSPGVTAQLAERVVEGTLHAAFTDLSVSHPDLLSRQIMEEPVVVCLPRSHPLATKPFLRPQDLEGIPIIAVSRETSTQQHREIEEYFEQFGVRLAVCADAFGPPEAISMVEQNVGVCLLEASAARGPGIVAKQLSIRKLTRKSGVYVREDNRNPTLAALVDMAIRRTQRTHHYPKLSAPVQKWLFPTFGEDGIWDLVPSSGVVLCGAEDAYAQEVEAGAAIHGPFDELEAMNLTFNWSVAPRLLKGREEGRFVSA